MLHRTYAKNLMRCPWQDAVLLKTGPGNPAATAFMAFLKGPEAKAIIERYGYATEDAK